MVGGLLPMRRRRFDRLGLNLRRLSRMLVVSLGEAFMEL